MERMIYFKNYRKFGKEIKKIVNEFVNADVFGSVTRGDFSVDLSDIDIAIVSDEFKTGRKG